MAGQSRNGDEVVTYLSSGLSHALQRAEVDDQGTQCDARRLLTEERGGLVQSGKLVIGPSAQRAPTHLAGERPARMSRRGWCRPITRAVSPPSPPREVPVTRITWPVMELANSAAAVSAVVSAEKLAGGMMSEGESRSILGLNDGARHGRLLAVPRRTSPRSRRR